ncbi:alpha-1,3-mannosyl-glycoprotein 4-beta-N-acetylglucosaminyltransferase B-like [Hoplias malabaricus]|uniref:alpha-1,3-mannosyl-glycoprotein 4-beta-N-acetylglucosaminyltransferase B-like n=1 Tax=Hoplias malabaricus TaxID=27720 RepID=UPI003462809C
MRRSYGKCLTLVLTFCGCIFMVTWQAVRHEPKGDLQNIYERLVRAEKRGEALSLKLLQVLENLQNLTVTGNNLTLTSNISLATKPGVKSANLHFLSVQPNALLYLSHLREHPNSLEPIVHVGQGRNGVSLVLAVPTVRRQKQSYLVNTLSSLLFDLTAEQKNDVVIVVFVAEIDSAFVSSVVESIEKNFPDDVKSGLVEVVSPSPYFYPNFSNLKETFGDSKERVKWRTKQNLDYSFLMLYSQHKATYYVQLEDDIVAKAGYTDSIKTHIQSVITQQWLYLEFSQLGFIGKLFRAADLPWIVEFILMFHKDKPIDWLLDHILWVKVCNPEKDSKHCSSEKAKLKHTFKPSLFQHVGLHSSLPGKIQKLKDKDFGKQVLFKAHSNPAAVLSTSLKDYQGHSLVRAYQGQDFFWGLNPMRGDYVLIAFTQPQNIKRYYFRSGNIETNGDKFYNTTVEVLPSDVSVKERVEKRELQCCKPSSDGFVEIGSFVNGVAEGELDGALGQIAAMRLLVHSDSDVWVLLSEIFIQV